MLDIRLEMRISKPIDKLLKAKKKQFEKDHKTPISIAELIRMAVVYTYERSDNETFNRDFI